MSEVESLRVLDIKVDIGGYVFGLNGRQVSGDDLGASEQVAHLNGPVAHARGNVEDGARRLRGLKWREEQPVSQEPLDSLALKRQSLLLRSVVGECVCCTSPWSAGDGEMPERQQRTPGELTACAIGVVGAAKLFGEVLYAVRQGGGIAPVDGTRVRTLERALACWITRAGVKSTLTCTLAVVAVRAGVSGQVLERAPSTGLAAYIWLDEALLPPQTVCREMIVEDEAGLGWTRCRRGLVGAVLASFHCRRRSLVAAIGGMRGPCVQDRRIACDRGPERSGKSQQ